MMPVPAKRDEGGMRENYDQDNIWEKKKIKTKAKGEKDV